MADRRIHLRTNSAFSWAPLRAQAGAIDESGTRRVEATVFALIPEYHQVKVRDGEGHVYALSRKTKGVDLASLHEGQHVVCTVTRKLPRVLTAAVVA